MFQAASIYLFVHDAKFRYTHTSGLKDVIIGLLVLLLFGCLKKSIKKANCKMITITGSINICGYNIIITTELD